MSALTKIFVVLHVVLSLVLVSGMIVFVNRVENYKTTLAQSQKQLQDAQNEASANRAEADSYKSLSDAAWVYARAELAASNDRVAAEQQNYATAQGQIGSLEQSLAQQVQVAKFEAAAQGNAQANAGRAQEEANNLRKETEALRQTNSQQSVQIDKLNNDLDYVRHSRDVALVQLHESQQTIERLSAGGRPQTNPSNAANNGAGAVAGAGSATPSLEGVVKATRVIGGVPYATISLGSAEGVKSGMKFMVIDRQNGRFLGYVTAQQIDAHESAGRVDPRDNNAFAQITPNTEVRTNFPGQG